MNRKFVMVGGVLLAIALVVVLVLVNSHVLNAGIAPTIEPHFAGATPSGRYEVSADVTDQVVEREQDNTLSFVALTPTPPLLCTATPTHHV